MTAHEGIAIARGVTDEPEARDAIVIRHRAAGV